MKNYILFLLTFFLSINVTAQSPSTPAKCFPSGLSFNDAYLSSDRKLVGFSTVNFTQKVYDINTMMIINPEEYKGLVPRFKIPEDVKNYSLKRSKPLANNDDQFYEVFDKAGKSVYKFAEEQVLADYFNSASGVLVVQKFVDKITVLRPDKRNIKMKMGELNWFNLPPVFDKNYNYMLLANGVIVNLISGEIRYNEFESKKSEGSKIILNNDGSNYSVTSKSGEIEVHNIATGKLLQKIKPLESLPKIAGFEMIPLPEVGDYIYWLNFNNKMATAGLAYLVKNNVSTSFCDPLWDEESNANYTKNLKELLENYKEMEKLKEERAKNSKNDGPSLADVLAMQYAERQKNAGATQNQTSDASNQTSTKQNPYYKPSKSYNEIIYDLRQVQKTRDEESARKARMDSYQQR